MKSRARKRPPALLHPTPPHDPALIDQVLSGERCWSLVRGTAARVLASLPAESVDAFVTPGQTKAIAGDGRLQARRLWREFVPLAHRAAKPDTAHVFFGSWKSPWMHSVLARHFAVKGCVVWYKKQWGLGWYLRPRWELAYLCHKGKPPLPEKAEPDVWEHSRDRVLIHPCQKPIDMLRRAVRLALSSRSRSPAPLVVDPFTGVASTGVAALAEGCRFLGSEVDKRYVTQGRDRLAVAERDQASGG